MGILGTPFGVVMRFIFDVVQNYGISLLLFTVLTRVIMIPLTIKQTKSSAKMAMVQPQIAEINKKYAGNRQKINEEMMGLYSKIGYNPASGCLPLIAQMAILFGVIDVIFRPLTHILRLPADVITAANDITHGLGIVSGAGVNAIELSTLHMLSLGQGDYTSIPSAYLEQMYGFIPQLQFWGVNLMGTPSLEMITGMFSQGFDTVLLIPILSGLTSVLLTRATMGQMSVQPSAPGMPNMKIMTYMMPVFSTVFTFTVPAGVGIYWIFANVVGWAQAKLLAKFFNPKQMADKHKLEMEAEKERERTERVEAKKRALERGETDDIDALSKKDRNARKLALARRRDAEKYGESVVDSDDDE